MTSSGTFDALPALRPTCLVFLPVPARGELFGQAVRGSIAPLSLSVVAGAFIFGLAGDIAGTRFRPWFGLRV